MIHLFNKILKFNALNAIFGREESVSEFRDIIGFRKTELNFSFTKN